MSSPLMIARIVDANLNRLSEGLRVVEDLVRFGLDDAPLAGRIKRLRHETAVLRRERAFINNADILSYAILSCRRGVDFRGTLK